MHSVRSVLTIAASQSVRTVATALQSSALPALSVLFQCYARNTPAVA